MTETDNPCIDFASDNLIGLRVGGLFGILAVSCIGVMIPTFSYRARFGHTYFFVRAFASGEQRPSPALLQAPPVIAQPSAQTARRNIASGVHVCV